MFKARYHPKAFLSQKRNVSRGLTARTKILSLLEKSPQSARMLAEKVGLRYASILHHLHLLEAESITTRGSEKPYLWRLTGAGQQRLIDIRDG